MLFGRAPSKDEIDISDTDAYLNNCMNGKLRRLSSRERDFEKGLSDALSAFGSAAKSFAESKDSPDMEYLYGIKEGNVIAQKPGYAATLVRIASEKPEYGGANIYYKSEGMLNAYNSLMHEVLKANNTFKLVMVAYVHGLAEVRKHFSTMERLCKDLKGELDACSQQVKEYDALHKKLEFIKDTMSKIRVMRQALNEYKRPVPSDSKNTSSISLHIENKEKELELQRQNYNSKKSALNRLFLPIERVARKHDHSYESKRRLTDYIKEPMERLKDKEDISDLNMHITALIGEIASGEIEVKNPDEFTSMLKRINNTDILSMKNSLAAQKERIAITERELTSLHAELQNLNKRKDEQKRMSEEKNKTEFAIKSHLSAISDEKGMAEKLFLDYYRKHVGIKINTDNL